MQTPTPRGTDTDSRAARLLADYARARRTTVEELLKAGMRLVPCGCHDAMCPGYTLAKVPPDAR